MMLENLKEAPTTVTGWVAAGGGFSSTSGVNSAG